MIKQFLKIWFSVNILNFATKFFRNTLLYIFVSQKFKLKLISANFLFPMIALNELSITLSTLWLF